jgi:hypoxanthine phosphoribosyltransferase
VVTDLTLLDEIGKRCYTDKEPLIIVDEICDGGNTFKLWQQRFPNILTATLYLRHNSKFKPDFWGYKLDTDQWIIFPWECDG